MSDQNELFENAPEEIAPAGDVETPAAADTGGASGPPAFAPLPPLPDGDSVPLAQYAERAYLEYAVSVVKGRALPDVGDGQKPVQRRILYAMREMGLSDRSKPVKSARVVGECMGKFHPHGDASAYDAMVRLAQSFSLRYPLVDGQGNFGTRDGDNAAAMRYTEVRLTPLADLLLSELDMGTVDMVPNYDGHLDEPALLPARLPMVLLNGASGIAVGMATEIPSHNLTEVAAAAALCVREPDVEDERLLEWISGPDLPGGGQIISPAAEITACYRSGRGSLKMRARWRIEELARGQWRIVVYELPHGTSARKVLEEIEDLTNPKVKTGKKALSQDQVQNKQLLLSVLDRVADESDKDQAVRLVFEPKSGRQSSEELINILLTHTSLEGSLPMNMVMIGIDGRPRQKPLVEILREWAQFRVGTVRRRTAHRLGRVEDRIHILEGRMVVYLNIDEVIALIRESDEPKAALMARFNLSERQAEDILEIRLRQLARLEGIRIEQELDTLRKEQAELQRLLGSEALLRRRVAKEIEQDAKQFGDERRTLIEAAERATLSARVVDEPVTLIVSKKHWARTRLGHGLDLSSTTFKEGDGLLVAFECRTTDTCLVLCDNGRVCSVPVAQIPGGRGEGAPLAALIELAPGAKIAHVIGGDAATAVLLATSGGYGFGCTLGDMIGRNKAGKQFITLPEGETLLAPVLYDPVQHRQVAAVSGKRLLVFPLAELKVLGGGRGVILMGLNEREPLTAVCPFADALELLLGNGKTRLLKAGELAPYLSRRARMGRTLTIRGEVTGLQPAEA